MVQEMNLKVVTDEDLLTIWEILSENYSKDSLENPSKLVLIIKKEFNANCSFQLAQSFINNKNTKK